MSGYDPNSDDADRTLMIPHDAVDGEVSGGRRGCVTVIHGRGQDLGKFQVVVDEVVIGRGQRSDFVIGDFGASRRHCRLYREGDEDYFIEDLESMNGTILERKPLEAPRCLRDGDKILIGETVLRFRIYDELDLRFISNVEHLIGTDPLTGLQAKRTFDDALEYAIVEANRAKRPLSLMMMDLDGIKQINDTHGHLFGAFSIQQAGRIIKEVIGSTGRASRFGGDEFTVFLPDAGLSAATETAEAIRAGLESAGLEKDGVPLKPTISIGVAALPEDGDKYVTLVDAADQRLYRAKREGKNRVCCA